MSKVILNLATNLNQKLVAQGISDFVLDLKHVVGLVELIGGMTTVVELTYKVDNNPAVKVFVNNDFDVLVEDLIAFNPEFFVATTNDVKSDVVPVVGIAGLSFVEVSYNLSKRFLVNSKRLSGVARKNGKTEITLRAPKGSERKAFYVDVSKFPKGVDVDAYVKIAIDNAKADVSPFYNLFGIPVATVAETKPKPVTYIIEEDFDEIASLVVYGAFDPELD